MSNGYTKITLANVTDYPVGTRIRFDYGAGCGEEFGLVEDYETTQWGTSLVARTEAGEIKKVSGISTMGVGVYLAPSLMSRIDPAAHHPNLASALEVVGADMAGSPTLETVNTVTVPVYYGNDTHIITIQEQAEGGWVFLSMVPSN